MPVKGEEPYEEGLRVAEVRPADDPGVAQGPG